MSRRRSLSAVASSAEVIAERISDGSGNLISLANFGEMSFNSVSADGATMGPTAQAMNIVSTAGNYDLAGVGLLLGQYHNLFYCGFRAHQ